MYKFALFWQCQLLPAEATRELRRAIPFILSMKTGRVSEILSSYNKLGENSLSEKNLSDIKMTPHNYKTDYDGRFYICIRPEIRP